jgi:hypothetical protein
LAQQQIRQAYWAAELRSSGNVGEKALSPSPKAPLAMAGGATIGKARWS